MKKIIRRYFFIILFLLIAFFISCTSTYNLQKETEEKNDSAVALLYKDFDWGGGNVDANSIQLYQVDDKLGPCKGIGCMNRWYGSSFDGSYRIRLLPGEHTVYFRFNSNCYVDVIRNGKRIKGFPKFKAFLKFNAKAAHMYYIKADYDPKNNKAKAWIEDVITTK